MRKSPLTIASLALVLGLAACSDVIGGLGIGGLVGEYDLQSVNGFQLPVIVYQDAFEQDELLFERFTIYADGSYTDEYTLRVSSSRGQSTETFRDSGTYTRFDSQLEFQDSRTGDVFDGEVNGRTLTINQAGNFYVFRR